MTAAILLDPVDFMALHLSSLAWGGIGGWTSWKNGEPWCAQGHAQFLDGAEPRYPSDLSGPSTPFTDRVRQGDWTARNDAEIRNYDPRMEFEEYIQKVNIDIKETA